MELKENNGVNVLARVETNPLHGVESKMIPPDTDPAVVIGGIHYMELKGL